MHPLRRIEEINSTLGRDEDGAASIRAAAKELERRAGVGEILAAVADDRFPAALIAASRGRLPREEWAWLTLAAAGAERARQVLAWRASQLVDPEQLALAAAIEPAGDRVRQFAAFAAEGGSEAEAAWRLLALLRASELEAMVQARPALAAAHGRLLEVGRPTRARPLRPALG